MVANPALIPLTVVTVRRVLVTPSGMMRFGGNAIAIEGSLLASVMTTPPAGAAAPKVIGKLTVSPGANVTFPGKSIPPAAGPRGRRPPKVNGKCPFPPGPYFDFPGKEPPPRRGWRAAPGGGCVGTF